MKEIWHSPKSYQSVSLPVTSVLPSCKLTKKKQVHQVGGIEGKKTWSKPHFGASTTPQAHVCVKYSIKNSKIWWAFGVQSWTCRL